MFNAGDAVGLEVFAHRQLWNGTVCSAAEAWQCGASTDFREDYCARGDPRCFVKDVFDAAHPQLVFRAAEQGLTAPQAQLKNQIMLLWSRRAREPFGIGEPKAWSLAGLYRIREATSVGTGIWSARPHSDGWVNLTSLNMDIPRYDHIPSARRMRRFEPATVRKLLQQATAAASRPATPLPEEQRRRLEKVSSLLDTWFDAAKIDGEPLQKLFGAVHVAESSSGSPVVVAGDDRKLVNPMRGLDALKRVEPAAWDGVKAAEPSGPARRPSDEPGPVRQPANTGGATTTSAKGAKDGADGKAKVDAPITTIPVPAADADNAVPGTGVDPIGLRTAAAKTVAENYGSDVLRKVQVALLTKPLLILRGNPGVGKSNLAKMLSDERLIVAIGSTWRGREDLLGYVNPINQLFEPTAFCHFLFEAERAWLSGDHAMRVVVFEEFNLSPPEFWLSDILVRTQYDANERENRSVDLGAPVRGLTDQRSAVFLSPSIRFVATMNNDHTTKPLSPRVLDRASIIALDTSVERAIASAKLNLDGDQIEAIKGLDFRGRRRGASFSLRSALSLKECLLRADFLGLDEWQVVDHVLVQEVLSKLQLLAGDQNDREILDKLQDWAEEIGERLPLCAKHLDDCLDALESGSDVRP